MERVTGNSSRELAHALAVAYPWQAELRVPTLAMNLGSAHSARPWLGLEFR